MRYATKVILTLIGVLVILVSLVITLSIVKRQQKTRVKAAGINLTFYTPTTSVNVNSLLTVTMTVDTQAANLTGADLKIKYDPLFLEATQIVGSDFLPTVLIPGKIENGLASVTVACLVNEQAAYPKSGVGALANVTFKAKKAGTTSVSFDSGTLATVTGQDTNAVGTTTPLNLTLIGPTNLPTATPTPTTTATPTATPTPTPTATPTIRPTVTPTLTANPTATATSQPTLKPTTTPTPTATGPKAGDINGDGAVNILDITKVIAYYGQAATAYPAANLNGDDTINLLDILVVIKNYDK